MSAAAPNLGAVDRGCESTEWLSLTGREPGTRAPYLLAAELKQAAP